MTDLPDTTENTYEELQSLIDFSKQIRVVSETGMIDKSYIHKIKVSGYSDWCFSLIEKYSGFIDKIKESPLSIKLKVIVREQYISREDVHVCKSKKCQNQVNMMSGKRNKRSDYCSRGCAASVRNEESKFLIDEETGLSYSKIRSNNLRDTLENTIDEDGLTLEQKRHRATSEGRLKLTEEGISIAAYHTRTEAERRRNTIDPETGMDLNQLYGQRAKEANSVVGEDGLTTFQRLGRHLVNFYKTPEGKEIKRKQTIKQRRSLIGKNSTKNLCEDEKKRYRIYRRRVRYFTEFNDLSLLEGYDKWGDKMIDNDAYQLDHIYSVSMGFEENIPPYIIGSIENLQFIHWKENSTKGPKCWITKEELFEKVLGTDYDSLINRRL